MKNNLRYVSTLILGSLLFASACKKDDSITVTPPTSNETVTGISRTSALRGAPITITGTNFRTPFGDNVVTFNGAPATIYGGTATTLNVYAPKSTAGAVVVDGVTGPSFSYITPANYDQEDQVARPAINTVFNSGSDKDLFNVTTPGKQTGYFGPKFKAALLALNPDYTTNALNMDADAFVGLNGLLSTDILNVSLSGATAFGPTALTGRGLADDVIDLELLLIFGGPDGSAKPTLTSDNVDANDHPFASTFPYLAASN